MSKKIFQIVSLIVSAISLIYLILSYNGLIRYMNLHFMMPNKLIEKYKNLSKLGKERVIISYEWKNNNSTPFINSLLDQSVRVDDIGVTSSSENSSEVKEHAIVSPYTYAKNYERCGNLINSILRERDADTKIILLDPYIIYGEDFIETLLLESEKNPDKIIYGNSDKSAKNGILIKPKFFDTKINMYQKGMSDIWLEKNALVDSIVLDYKHNYKSFRM